MKELQYPFDANYILTKKRKIKRQLLEGNSNFLEKKIAILGGSTTNDIKLILEIFLLNYGIKPIFYESEYNQFYQEAIFENKNLENFNPDIIYICTTNRNITCYPNLKDNANNIKEMLEIEINKFKNMWDHLLDVYECPIIQNNFEMPFYRLLGNKDASDIHGRTNYITRLNMAFYEYAQTHDNFYICDINYISADYGLKEWSEPFYYYMYKYALNVNAIPYLSFNIANIIKSIFGKNKKGFVLDLDNTLWGGVIGDDGVENIILGPETSEGEAYMEFQQYLKEHLPLGVILNINSKNDYKNAIAGLNHINSKLHEKDFIDIKANWNPKNENFKLIANDLNLLPESMVFIDDNPAERHIVAKEFPNASVPEMEKVENYIQIIDRNGFFESTIISKDDIKRNEMYKENIERRNLQSTFLNYNDYLISLSMKAIIKSFIPVYYARIAQLSNKSNQFNLTTKRYTQKEIEEISKNEKYISLYGKLEDRFGDNGVVSVVIGNIIDEECKIDLWIMSCRVLKRNMEYAMMDALVKKCKEKNIKRIKGYYYPTSKNSMVKDFYKLQGFIKINEDVNGNTEWLFSIPEQYENKNKVIKVED